MPASCTQLFTGGQHKNLQQSTDHRQPVLAVRPFALFLFVVISAAAWVVYDVVGNANCSLSHTEAAMPATRLISGSAAPHVACCSKRAVSFATKGAEGAGAGQPTFMNDSIAVAVFCCALLANVGSGIQTAGE